MLAILSAVFGFAAPFLPEIIKLIKAKGDRKHEIDMLRLRMEAAAKASMHRVEEINAQADIAETQAIRLPQPSFGVQVLDAATKLKWPSWVVIPIFYLFSLLDFLSGLVRTAITYAAFIFYIAYKWAILDVMTRDGAQIATALMNIWTENDWAVLTLVLSYWFGARAARSIIPQVAVNR